jgi:acetolactate synthase-1/2/3 large subunit
MNCAEFLIDFLSHRGVKYVFTLPGSHIYPLWMALDHSSCITPIVTCHELSAGYMADGYARSSRTLAVVMTIGGPGSNNLIPAVNTARIERVPLLIITGDVPIQLYDKMAFQCSTYLGTNDDALYQVAAKWSRRVSNADQFPDLLHEAVSSALSYPQGPSHLIIPYDIQ